MHLTPSKIIRRTHMYLALFLTPWLIIYALSGLVLNHFQTVRNAYGGGIQQFRDRRRARLHRSLLRRCRPENDRCTSPRRAWPVRLVQRAGHTERAEDDDQSQRRAADPQWLRLWEKEYAIDVPAGTENLREVARRVLADNGLTGPFGIQRQGQQLNINVPNFWHPKRVVYDLEKNRLWAEQKKFAWVELLARLHVRTGYGTGGFLNNLWALVVDVFCVTLLVWVGTGLYLWWKLSVARRWGFITLGGGVISILLLLLTL